MHSSLSSTPSSDSTNKFSFPPGSVIDPIEIVHIFDHASEKFLFLSSLQERVSNPERRKFILDIIDRVRQLSTTTTTTTSSSSSSTMKNTSSTIMMPENLQRNFITVALPEILRSIPPANLRRQGIQHFGQIHQNNSKSTDDHHHQHDVENSNKDDEGTATLKSTNSASPSGCSCPCCQMTLAASIRKTTACACVARRIFISGKNGATNLSLLKHHGITHFVKCCELMPKHNSVDFVKDVLATMSLKRETEMFFAEDDDCSSNNTEKINKNNTKPTMLKCDNESDDEIFLDVGMKDDDKLSDGILKTFDRVLEFVKSKLRQSPHSSSQSSSNKSDTNDNKILIFCQAGKHRSAWCSAAVLAALSRDPSFACPCLIERTRYHSPLMYSVCYSIVKQCRNFVDFSPAAEENISRWIDERKLKTYHLDGAEESDDGQDSGGSHEGEEQNE